MKHKITIINRRFYIDPFLCSSICVSISAIDIPHSCDPSSSSSFSLKSQVNVIWNVPEFLLRGGWKIWYLKFSNCRYSKALERASIRNAKWGTNDTFNAVPQNVLIEFVRNTPPLIRWFRSDLTQDNMSILRLERPEIDSLN